MAEVLVTGAAGFVAKHCIAGLLKAGYAVRGTLRSLDHAAGVRTALERTGADCGRLSFVQTDLVRDGGWEAAASGCSYVLHIASPYPLALRGNPEDVIRPARDGTRRVLQAAARAGVRRVVLTSSAAAILHAPGKGPDALYSEADWTDTDRSDLSPYILSKTLAERDAWEFVQKTPGAPELSVLNPAFIQGPALDTRLSASLDVIRLIGQGVYPAAPRISLFVTDVRDVASLHIAAMTHPKAAGERFLVLSGGMRLMDVARLTCEACPDLAPRAPKFEMPDVLVRTLALFDPRLRSALPELGPPRLCTNAKARSTFGHAFRPAAEAVRDAARSLRELGVI